MRKRSWKTWLCAGLCAAAVAGSCLTSYADEQTTTETHAEPRKGRRDDGSVMAKIMSVSGDEIVVVMAEQPAGHEGEMPILTEGETPPEKPEGEEMPVPPERPEGDMTAPTEGMTPPEKPEGESADGLTPPEKTEGQPADAAQGGTPEMNFAAETTTLTLSSDAVITKGMDRETVSVSSLTEGTVARITLDGTTITSMELMEQR